MGPAGRARPAPLSGGAAGRRPRLSGAPRRPSTAGRRRALLYDWECEHVLGRRDQDVAFFEAAALRGTGPVLEMAAGTGRLTVPLARALAGQRRRIVGLDRDPATLLLARERAEREGVPAGTLQLVAADMTAPGLAGAFSAVLLPYNAVQLLDRAGALRCLAVAGALLAPGGTAVLEVTDFQGGMGGGSFAPERLAAGPFSDHDGRTVPIELWGALDQDLAGGRSTYRRRVVAPTWSVEDEVTLFAHPVDELLDRAGLVVATDERAGEVRRLVAGVRP